MKNDKPIIAITMGDINSIGPELCIKAALAPDVTKISRPVIIGSLAPMHRAVKSTHLNVDINCIDNIDNIENIKFGDTTINLFQTDDSLKPEDIQPGTISELSGRHSFSYIKTAIELAMSNIVSGTVTNAISKEAINMAGYKYPGHTEIYAHLTNTKKYSMMLIHGDFRVVHVSTHVSLRRACDLVQCERVLDMIKIAYRACVDMGIEHPTVGVCGLNPHAGESGMFGHEETEEIQPAIDKARREGINAVGPVPPDTIFPKARGGFYDIVVAMYHDQGHIPLKMEGFVYDKKAGRWKDVSGVNVTLGLPIIRTSVDHGTAMDQAYKNTASPSSLINAIETAVAFAKTKSYTVSS